jgi:HD-GYP domain-containing protein (c-di-GMP phosphodiesterase class II)
MEPDALQNLAAGEPSSQEAARDLVTNLHMLLKLRSIYEEGNEALRRPAQGVSSAVARLAGSCGDCRLRLVDQQFFLDQIRVKVGNEEYPHVMGLIDLFLTKGLGGLGFGQSLGEEEVLRFATLFQDWRSGDISLFSQVLGAEGLGGISLEGPQALGGSSCLPSGREKIRQRTRETFFGSIFLTGSLLRSTEQGQPVSMRRGRRLVQSFLDLLNVDEDYLLGLTAIKNYDDYTFNHSVNVTVLALNLGRHAGLSRAQLGDLGLAAMFHDVGKISLPREMVNKSARLSDQEWQAMYRHPVEGVKRLLQLKGIGELTVKLIISVYEHHRNFDTTGYPGTPLTTNPSLIFPRILRIVDSFDAMTTRRIYTAKSKHPVEAVEEIWNLAGRIFDPDLARLFVNMMGIYPVGTVVQLESGEIALVVGQERSEGGESTPRMMVLADWQGKSPVGTLIQTDRAGPERIVGYYDFGDSGIETSWFLLKLEEQIRGEGGD